MIWFYLFNKVFPIQHQTLFRTCLCGTLVLHYRLWDPTNKLWKKLDLQEIMETICYIFEMKSLYYGRVSIIAMFHYLQSNVSLPLTQTHQLIFSARNKQPKFNYKYILQNISLPLDMTLPELNCKFNIHTCEMTQVVLQSIHLKPVLLLLVIASKLIMVRTGDYL